MQQINIRVDEETDKLLDYLAESKKIPKAIMTKQLLLENLTEKILPLLLQDYQAGKIGLKRILKLTSIPPDELLDKIVKMNIEPPITPDIDDYTANVVKQLVLEKGKK